MSYALVAHNSQARGAKWSPLLWFFAFQPFDKGNL